LPSAREVPRWAHSRGTETVTLTTNQTPSHTHTVNARNNGTTGAATPQTPNNNMLGSPYTAQAAGPVQIYGTNTTGATSLLATTSSGGGNTPHSNVMPYTTLNYCIALSGLFPSRA